MGARLDLLHTHCKCTINQLYLPSEHAQCCSPTMPKESETSQALGRSGEAWLMSIFKGFCRVKAREPLVILAALTAGRRPQTGEQKKPPACSLWHLTSPQRYWTQTESQVDPTATTVCSHTSVPSPRNACSWSLPVCFFDILHLESCPLCHHIDSRTQPLTNSTVPAYVFLSDLQSLSCAFLQVYSGISWIYPSLL